MCEQYGSASGVFGGIVFDQVMCCFSDDFGKASGRSFRMAVRNASLGMLRKRYCAAVNTGIFIQLNVSFLIASCSITCATRLAELKTSDI